MIRPIIITVTDTINGASIFVPTKDPKVQKCHYKSQGLITAHIKVKAAKTSPVIVIKAPI